VTVGIVVNPSSGPPQSRLSAEALVAWSTDQLRRLGVDPWVGVIEGPGHGAHLARQAVDLGASLVVAWGGDGTVNAVASGLVNTPTPLGIIPAGSGNGLARELGIPSDRRAALEVAVRGRERVIDAGTLNGHFFFNVAGIGFDAHVAHVFAHVTGRMRGVVGYTATIVRELFRYQPSHYQVRGDDGEIDRVGGALFISLANTTQWGNGAEIAPQARPDDGLLDLVLIDQRPPLVILGSLWRLYNKSVRRIGGTVMVPVRGVTLVATPAAPLHTDGEPIGTANQITVRVVPGGLRVRVPRER